MFIRSHIEWQRENDLKLLSNWTSFSANNVSQLLSLDTIVAFQNITNVHWRSAVPYWMTE